MSDKVTAYIRTFAPIVAGAIISYIASLGLDLSGAQDLFVIALTALFQLFYYALARLLGTKYPKAEALLLGSSKTPVYTEEK